MQSGGDLWMLVNVELMGFMSRSLEVSFIQVCNSTDSTTCIRRYSSSDGGDQSRNDFILLQELRLKGLPYKKIGTNCPCVQKKDREYGRAKGNKRREWSVDEDEYMRERHLGSEIFRKDPTA